MNRILEVPGDKGIEKRVVGSSLVSATVFHTNCDVFGSSFRLSLTSLIWNVCKDTVFRGVVSVFGGDWFYFSHVSMFNLDDNSDTISVQTGNFRTSSVSGRSTVSDYSPLILLAVIFRTSFPFSSFQPAGKS